MIYSDFVTEVQAQMATDANRRGLEAFQAQQIANALTDLQRFIRSYREDQTTTYALADVTQIGCAQLVQLPTGAKPKACYIFSTNPKENPLIDRYRLDFYPWKSRQNMIDGRLAFSDWWDGLWGGTCPPVSPPPNCNGWEWCRRQKMFVYSIGPAASNFLIYPPLNANRNLLLVWEGYKTDWSAGDVMPCPDNASEAVAEYVKWKIARDIDKNPQLAKDRRADYEQNRRSLLRDYQDALEMEGTDQEYGAGTVPPPDGFAWFGGQSVARLGTITGLTGVLSTDLAAVPTLSLTVPVSVIVQIGGIDQMWTLQTGTDATDTAQGILQPNDYINPGNTKVWYQSNI